MRNLRKLNMVKNVNRSIYMYDWGERAVPALVISHHKCSKCPKLETIAEEAGAAEDLGATHKLVKFMFAVPVFISIASYLLLYRHIM